jgi:hypothetical protein
MRTMLPPGEAAKVFAWCRHQIGRGEVFTSGHDLGKVVAVCRTCIEPPAPGSGRLLELVQED